MSLTAVGAVIEILERGKVIDGVIVPNEIRINGQPLLSPENAPVVVHELNIHAQDLVQVTLTLMARRVIVGVESDVATQPPIRGQGWFFAALDESSVEHPVVIQRRTATDDDVIKGVILDSCGMDISQAERFVSELQEAIEAARAARASDTQPRGVPTDV